MSRLAKKLKICIAALLIVFVALMVSTSTAQADQNSAQSAIASAQNTLKSCYQAVEQAQAEGANVDQLTPTLNNAASLLSDAQLAYASNDYDSAYTYATQSQSTLNGFVAQANALQASANNANGSRFLTEVASIAISLAILCVGIAAWANINRKGRKA